MDPDRTARLPAKTEQQHNQVRLEKILCNHRASGSSSYGRRRWSTNDVTETRNAVVILVNVDN